VPAPDAPAGFLPERVWVLGPCGAGKSVVAATLAGRLGVAPTHLDELHWRPGWIEADPREEEAALDVALRGPRWVVDGNYGRLRRRHLARVGLFVWLDLPLTVAFPRLLRRSLVRALHGVPCCNGNRESLRRTFLHRESILLWALTTDRRRRRELQAELAPLPHVRLRHPQAIRRWLAAAWPPASGVSAAARSGRS
jgi:adenylate kinase family enzyme